MKKSLKQGAGYLVIDHTNSPGLRPEDVAHVPGAVAVGEGQIHERDIQQCSHCERAIVLEPLRVRDRGHCQKCHHYVCDSCETIRAKTGECVPMRKRLDLAQAHMVGSALHPYDPLAPLPHTPLISLTDL